MGNSGGGSVNPSIGGNQGQQPSLSAYNSAAGQSLAITDIYAPSIQQRYDYQYTDVTKNQYNIGGFSLFGGTKQGGGQ
jgi:hypothetical protein